MGGDSFGGKDPQWIVKPEKKNLHKLLFNMNDVNKWYRFFKINIKFRFYIYLIFNLILLLVYLIKT